MIPCSLLGIVIKLNTSDQPYIIWVNDPSHSLIYYIATTTKHRKINCAQDIIWYKLYKLAKYIASLAQILLALYPARSNPNATLLNLEVPANMLLWDIGCLQEIITTRSHIMTSAKYVEVNSFDSIHTKIIKSMINDKWPATIFFINI